MSLSLFRLYAPFVTKANGAEQFITPDASQPFVEEELVAPCGVNCSVCAAHLAMIHDVKSKGIRIPYCAGCRPRGKTCALLKKRCDLLLENKIKFCYECPTFPCPSLETIDRRYRKNYRMSEIENLRRIKAEGIKAFLKSEEKRWRCPKCGGLVSCHNGLCFNCDLEKLRRKKRVYSWE